MKFKSASYKNRKCQEDTSVPHVEGRGRATNEKEFLHRRPTQLDD